MYLVLVTSHDCGQGSETTRILGVNAPVEDHVRHSVQLISPGDKPATVKSGKKTYKVYYLGGRTCVQVEQLGFWRRFFGQQSMGETISLSVHP